MRDKWRMQLVELANKQITVNRLYDHHSKDYPQVANELINFLDDLIEKVRQAEPNNMELIQALTQRKSYTSNQIKKNVDNLKNTNVDELAYDKLKTMSADEIGNNLDDVKQFLKNNPLK